MSWMVQKLDIRKGDFPGSRYNTHGYILTYSKLTRGNLWLSVEDCNFCIHM